MYNNITVSVFMMTYNHEKYIAQALDSVLMQKVDFIYEIVLGEDYSTDNTREIVVKYAERYPDKFKLLLHKTNIGASKNQEAVFNSCNGKYIAMCEGDDYWTDPYKLQKQVDFLEANDDYALCFHEVNIKKNDAIYPDTITRNVDNTSSFQDLLDGNFIHTPSVLFLRKYLENITFPKYGTPILGDHYLWLSLAQYGKFKKINKIMGIYRVHAGGVWSMNKSKYKEKIYAGTLLALSRHLESKTFRKKTNQKFLKFTTKRLLLSLYKFDFKTSNYYLSLLIKK